MSEYKIQSSTATQVALLGAICLFVVLPLSAEEVPAASIQCQQPVDPERLKIIAELSEETVEGLRTRRSVTPDDICRMPVKYLQKALDRLSHPKPDFPDRARKFRYLHQLDEHGEFNAENWLEAREQVMEMRQGAQLFAGVETASWEELGPGNIGGRIRSLAFDPDDADRIYAGAVAGGVWLTENAGTSWAPLDDFMANLSISSLIFDPTDSDVMYAGTGEGTFNIDNIRGLGIFRSTDKGASWASLTATADSFDFYWVNRLAMLGDGSRLLAATYTGIWYSEDDGATWTKTVPVDTDELPVVGRSNDVDINPTDDTKAVAGTWSGALYSVDGGLTWALAAGLDSVGYARIEVAYAQSDPDVVYASVDNASGQVYRSIDGGQTYSLLNSGSSYLGSQGWYDNALWVDPVDENHIVVGGIDLWRSTDGGATLDRISSWWLAPDSAHADHHFVIEHPDYDGDTNKQVYFANDGGVYVAADIELALHGSGWQELNNNLAVTQFYGFGVAPDGTIVGGTQDNGTLIYKGDSEGWTETFGGDGGYSAADPTDSNYLYGEYIDLQIHRSTNGGVFSSYIYTSAMLTGANFIAPFILDPNNENRLLGGAHQLWVSDNVKAPSPFWTSIKGPAPIENPSSISAIAVVPGNSDIIYVGHNNGALYRTYNGTDASPLWVQIGDASLPQRYLMRIAVDPVFTDLVYASFSGYSTDNLWKSTDGGETWAPASGTAPNAIPAAPIRTIAIHPSTTSQLHVGTEVGIFASSDGGMTWNISNDGPANVSVDELRWHDEATLYAATHGRGIFRADLSEETPDALVFDSVLDAEFSTQYTSNADTISGLGFPVDMTVSGGEYSLGCTGTFTTAPAVVSNGDSVCLRHTSADDFYTVVSTRLTIGTSTFSFDSRTIPSLIPDGFAISPEADVPINVVVVSEEVVPTGFDVPIPITVTNGEYSINCSANSFTANAGQIAPFESVCVRHTSSGEYLDAVTSTLDINGVSADFTSTTMPDMTPDPFSFDSLSDVKISSLQTSSTALIQGIAVDVDISVTGGEYSIGCTAAFTSDAGILSNGDSVCLRHTSSAFYTTQQTTFVFIGTESATFVSVTREAPPPGDEFLDLVALADVNGNNNTDVGLLFVDIDENKNMLSVLDGGNGNNINTVPFGPELVKGSTAVPDATGDQVPEYAVLVEGSLFARVKDVVNSTLLGKPAYSSKHEPVAFFSVGDIGGAAGPELAVVGRNPANEAVQAQIKEAESGAVVSRFDFSKAYIPFDAVAVDNVGDSSAMEIAVLGIDASGNVRAQIKDAQSGNLIGKIKFNKAFTPLAFAAVPDANGDLTNLAVLGRNGAGVIQAQIKRASDGVLVSKVKFSPGFDPRSFVSFVDSNGSGGGEVAVIGVDAAGKVRAQTKEIADGAPVSLVTFSSGYPPLDAIALSGAAGTGRSEIAVLGQNDDNEYQLQIKDLLTGDLVSKTVLP